MRREIRRTSVFTRRALLLMGGQVAVLGTLGARLYQLQVVDAARYKTLANDNRISARLVAPPRGRILDRFGIPVADNKPNWRALLIAERTNDVRATLDRFSTLVPLDDRERERIQRDLHRNRSFIPVLVRDYLTWDEMARIEVNAPELPGIVVDAGSTRNYPFGPQLAHLIGYVGPPNERDLSNDPLLSLPGIRVGRTGVEKYHDLALRGRAGVVQLEVNAVGRVVRELSRQDGVPGDTIGLTIDSALQQAALQHLGDQSGSAVVLDCTNGEILAMATNPSFDPGLFNSGVPQAQWNAWMQDPMHPLMNKATRGLYAPGSTFKMTVALAAQQTGAVSPTQRFFCPGYFEVGDRRFWCWRRGGHGWLDMVGGLKNSCDVYFYQAALHTGIDPIAGVAHRLGLGVDLPKLDLPEQRTGLVPTREWRKKQGHPWQLGDTVVAGIGQGYIEVTPVQLATYVSRIATGRAVQPHVTRSLSGVEQPGMKPEDWPMLDIPDRQLQVARQGMWEVVNDPRGTAPAAKLPDPRWQMAGKTGSAQVVAVPRALRLSGHFNSADLPWKYRPNALFVAFAPFDAPRYA
ncbi:MAG TPA: penicillin-binding protein 2, partial [Acetobacteraceae bacterium]|nr:penicillin-binding protein 2 [Acetobacteraceae bacterium]